jgi:hypothetical protein
MRLRREQVRQRFADRRTGRLDWSVRNQVAQMSGEMDFSHCSV